MKRQFSVSLIASAVFGLALGAPIGAQNPDHVKQLRATRQCSGCDLRNADLQGLQAELGDLSGADLSGARLYKSNLRGADLTAAVLNDADLSGADLRETRGADLAGARTDERTMCPNGAAGPCK